MSSPKITDMCETDAVELLQEAIACYCEEALSPEDELEVTSFDAAGILTIDKGFVIRMPDHSEFQITIIKCR